MTQITTHIPNELHQILKQASLDHNLTIKEITIQALTDILQKLKKKKVNSYEKS